MYKVRKAKESLREVINPKRGPIIPVPGLSWKAWAHVADTLFTEFGLAKYVGCVTAEMRSRPVPHVFRLEQVRAVTELYEKRAPAILARLIDEMVPPIQPLNKQSRLGWPWFDHPERALARETKKQRLSPFFRKLEEQGAASTLHGSFIIMNVRLQAEDKDKERDMLFVDPEGVVYPKKVNKEDRVVSAAGAERVASRTRLVFNMPCANLYKQVLDTALHHVLLKYPAFHHNLYSPTGTLPVRGSTLFLDVKHFERHTAALARARARIIGGLYGDIVEQFTAAPFLCPTDNWKGAYMLWPDRAGGWSDQFASGDSSVAPVQKEVFVALYQEFAETHLRIPASQSLAWVLQGGDARLTIRNYGDDNSLSGDQQVLSACFDFLRGYLEVEEEQPPKFLGFLWTDNRWRLGVESYLSKTYLNERKPGPPFRRFPYFGWTEKRKVYAEYGVAELEGAIFPRENLELEAAGLPWSKVQVKAAEEAFKAMGENGALISPSWLLDKDYLMTAEEKIESGLYEGMFPGETAPMIMHLLGPQWRKKIRWRT